MKHFQEIRKFLVENQSQISNQSLLTLLINDLSNLREYSSSVTPLERKTWYSIIATKFLTSSEYSFDLFISYVKEVVYNFGVCDVSKVTLSRQVTCCESSDL